MIVVVQQSEHELNCKIDESVIISVYKEANRRNNFPLQI